MSKRDTVQTAMNWIAGAAGLYFVGIAIAGAIKRKREQGVKGIGALLSKKDQEDFRTYWEDERDWRIKDWYRRAYPTDDMGEDLNGELTFNQLCILMKYEVPFYELVGAGDSIVRERIFHKLCEIYNKPYDYFYNLWLNS